MKQAITKFNFSRTIIVISFYLVYVRKNKKERQVELSNARWHWNKKNFFLNRKFIFYVWRWQRISLKLCKSFWNYYSFVTEEVKRSTNLTTAFTTQLSIYTSPPSNVVLIACSKCFTWLNFSNLIKIVFQQFPHYSMPIVDRNRVQHSLFFHNLAVLI